MLLVISHYKTFNYYISLPTLNIYNLFTFKMALHGSNFYSLITSDMKHIFTFREHLKILCKLEKTVF